MVLEGAHLDVATRQRVDALHRGRERLDRREAGDAPGHRGGADVVAVEAPPRAERHHLVEGVEEDRPRTRRAEGLDLRPVRGEVGVREPRVEVRERFFFERGAGVDPSERVVCTGGWYFGGRTWHCHKKGGHGVQNMHDAIKNSCDVYFYQMALRIGPDPIHATATAMGFGQTFDLGIPGQRKGLVGSREWKKKAFKRDPIWHPGDSVPYGIGQGYINVNADYRS